MLALFDAHSHLPHAQAQPQDRARVVCGTCEADWHAVLAHRASNDRVLPMLGLHPWFVADATADWASILESLLRSHPAGVGECGLDFLRKETHRVSQEAAFRTQLRLAHALHRPVAIHIVRAWGRLLDLLREEGVPPAGALVHAYSGSFETAMSLQAMGVFLSFSGEIQKPDRANLRETLKAVDESHLLLETDGTADLPGVYEAAAAVRGVSMERLAPRIWENGQRCFKELMA